MTPAPPEKAPPARGLVQQGVGIVSSTQPSLKYERVLSWTTTRPSVGPGVTGPEPTQSRVGYRSSPPLQLRGRHGEM
jgi:hypothetical protein